MRDFSKIKRVLIKIGSSSLVNSDFSVNRKMIHIIMDAFDKLHNEGIEVALVSSGAIACGMHELHLTERPKNMALKQACAAVGQAKLMEEYNKAADIYNLVCGQILVNHDDFQVRKRMLYLSNTLDAMFKNNIIPIINENDALAVEEIKVGDNDTLASLIAPMIHSDLLILFSDIDGLYNKNPKLNKDAELIKDVYKIDEDILKMAEGKTTVVGTGGMATKLTAAKISTSARCDMIICNSNKIENITSIVKGEEIGTLFHKEKKGISSRDHWMIFKTHASGSIIIDDGCKSVLSKKKVSILAKGVVGVVGSFLEDSVIEVVDLEGNVLAKGITKYSSNDIDSIKGQSNDEVSALTKKKPEVIHADDLVIVKE